jgi:hypothetical protein
MRLALPPVLFASMLVCACGNDAETAEPTAPAEPTPPVQPTVPAPPAPLPTPTQPTTLEATSSAGWQITRYEGRDYGFHGIAFDVNSRGPVFALYTRTGLVIGALAGPLEEVPGTEPHLDFTRAGVAFAFAQGGIPHAFFIDTARPGVGYVTRNGDAWQSEAVLGGEALALPHLAFDGAGAVHGAVVDVGASSITQLSRSEDGTWQSSVAARFDQLDALSDIARDPRGELWMAACARVESGSELSIFRLAATPATPTPPISVGTFEGRCGGEGTMPASFGFAFRADGTAHVLVPVQGGENGDALVHFASTSDLALAQAWARTDIASIEFGACESTLAIDPQGELHAAFTKHRGEMGEATELYYGAFLSESWRIERIDEDTRYRDMDAPSLHMRQTSIAVALRGHLVSEAASTIHLFQRPRR